MKSLLDAVRDLSNKAAVATNGSANWQLEVVCC